MTATTWHLPIKQSIAIAWEKIYGIKAIIWRAVAFALLFIAVCTMLYSLFFSTPLLEHPVCRVILQLLLFLFQMGFLFMGIQRAKGSLSSWRTVFKAFEGYMPIHLISLYLLQFCIALIPVIVLYAGAMLTQSPNAAMQTLGTAICFLAVLLTYFLLLRMIMSAALVMDKNMGPWEAIRQSFHLTQGNVLRLFVLNLFQYLVLMVSIFTGIGLIWGIPLTLILYGLIYLQLVTHRGLLDLPSA